MITQQQLVLNNGLQCKNSTLQAQDEYLHKLKNKTNIVRI